MDPGKTHLPKIISCNSLLNSTVLVSDSHCEALSHIIPFDFSQPQEEVGIIIILILQMGQLSIRNVNDYSKVIQIANVKVCI